MKNILFATAVFFTMFSSFTAYATHAYGGEITWKCESSGPNAGKFKFYMNLYRDCGSGNATLPGGTVILNSNSPAGSITLTQVGSNTDVSPTCYLTPSPVRCNQVSSGQGALEEARYESGYITLSGTPPVTGWVFTFSLCCRPNTISNLVNPGSTNLFLRAIMYPYSVQGLVQNTGNCYDSSPQFLEAPKSVACTGSKFTYSQIAFDQDMDSSHFEWANVMTAAGQTIGFVSPYSLSNQLPSGANPATLNSETGTISFLPQTGGSFATAVKVSSYRCGQLISVVVRDIPLVVRTNCPNLTSGSANTAPSVSLVSVPGYPALNPIIANSDTLKYEVSVLAGQEVKFNMIGNDAQLLSNMLPQSIIFSGLGGNFGSPLSSSSAGCALPPCATVLPVAPQSSLTSSLNNEVQFSWQTSCLHVPNDTTCLRDIARYVYVLRMSDNQCPIPATRLVNVVVNVQVPLITPPVTTNSQVSVLPNGDINLNWSAPLDTGMSFNGYVVYHSSVANGPYNVIDTIIPYSTQTFTHMSPIAGINYYLVRSLSGCGRISDASDTLKSIWLTEARPNPLDSSNVHLSWNAPTHGYSQFYSVWRSSTSASSWARIDSTQGLFYYDSIKGCGAQYSYRVQSAMNALSSSKSLWLADNQNNELHHVDSVLVNPSSVWLSWNKGLATDLQKFVVVRKDTGFSWLPVDTISSSNSTYLVSSRPFLTTEFRVYSLDSCGNSSSLSNTQGAVVMGTIGSEEHHLQNLTLSPNPTTGILKLSHAIEGTYEVKSIDGRLLARGDLPGTIDLTGFPDGLLIFVVRGQHNSKSFRVIKLN